MPTDRQRQAYDFISFYQQRRGYAPKLREIGDHLGVHSRGTIHRHLRALAAEGLIRIHPGRARGIELVPASITKHRPLTLPLLGRIAAGQPIEAIPGQDEIDLSEFFVRPDRFVLRVQGDSMVEDGILDGDMVIVERRDHANNGEIIVALIDNNEATLKHLQHNRDGTITLRPANHRLSPMRYVADRIRIQGVVVGQFRSYR